MNFFDSFFRRLFGGFSSNDRGCDWYCDNCNAYMNSQPGFTASSGEWICTECGAVNDVSEDNILYEEDEVEGIDSDDFDYDDDDDEEDDSERLSVDDAAAIWRSHGKDEDYMFGYTEEELEDA